MCKNEWTNIELEDSSTIVAKLYNLFRATTLLFILQLKLTGKDTWILIEFFIDKFLSYNNIKQTAPSRCIVNLNL